MDSSGDAAASGIYGFVQEERRRRSLCSDCAQRRRRRGQRIGEINAAAGAVRNDLSQNARRICGTIGASDQKPDEHAFSSEAESREKYDGCCEDKNEKNEDPQKQIENHKRVSRDDAAKVGAVKISGRHAGRGIEMAAVQD
ncbi:MAG: hypothetical protein R3C58_04155 [Parvularculaceae bacterium]